MSDEPEESSGSFRAPLGPAPRPGHEHPLIALCLIGLSILIVAALVVGQALERYEFSRSESIAGRDVPLPAPKSAPESASPGTETPAAKKIVPTVALEHADFGDVGSCTGFTARTSGVPRSQRLAYLTSMVACLTDANAKALAAEGIKLRAPTLLSADELQTSPCRDSEHKDWGAHYCSLDQTITYRPDQESDDDPSSEMVLIAHEFSHHLQWATGVLDDAETRVRAGANTDEVTRRVELQAACLVGAAIIADWSPAKLSPAQRSGYLDSLGRSPQEWDHTHGTAAAQVRWTKAGMTAGTTPYAGCTTWTAATRDIT